LLELYGLIAKGQVMKRTVNFRLASTAPEIMRNYERGLQVIEEMGEYHEQVPFFYYDLGCYYLTLRKPFDALAYLNKALVIRMTILTAHHPQLCPLY
jgi:hypothetical protein